MATLFDRRDDGGEIVVRQHHVGCLLGYLGTTYAHRDADVRDLQRRRVIDAVAGHRDHMTIGLQRLRNRLLVFRCDAGKHRNLLRYVAQLGLAQFAELGPRRHLLCGDTKLPRHRLGGIRVITGDHHGADAGFPTPCNRLDRRELGRVDHALQSGKTHVL